MVSQKYNNISFSRQMNKNRFLYIPGYGSSVSSATNSKKLQLISSLISPFGKITILDTQGKYTPDAYSRGLKDIIVDEVYRTYDSQPFDAVIGSSLGGFWATHYATEIFGNIPFILFNPVMYPEKQLIPIDPATAKSYSDVEEINEELAIVPALVIVASDDPVIPCGPTIGFFMNRAKVVFVESDDHTLEKDVDKYKKILSDFLLKDINRLAV